MSRKYKIYGDLQILPSSSTSSFGVGSVDIASDLAVGNNLQVSNTFTSLVLNNISNINSTNLKANGNIIFNDNIQLKQPTSYNVDCGLLVGLYQDENDTGIGEIINLSPPRETGSLQSHSGLSINQIKLDNISNSTADFYINYYIKITNGKFNNQVRKIIAYNGGFGKITQVNANWTPQIITGIVQVTDASLIVLGTSTTFLSDFDINDIILINNNNYIIQSIQSNTQLTLQVNAIGNFTGSGYQTHPRINATYLLNNERFSTIIYNKNETLWKMGYTNDNPLNTSVNVTRLATLQVYNLETSYINGTAISLSDNVTETVNVIDNSGTPTIINNSSLRGSYLVVAQSTNATGACATFLVSKSGQTKSANIVRVTSSASATDEEIQISYNIGEKIGLYHETTKTNGSGSLISYNVKLIEI
jgi:hypothetical protein